MAAIAVKMPFQMKTSFLTLFYGSILVRFILATENRPRVPDADRYEKNKTTGFVDMEGVRRMDASRGSSVGADGHKT